MTHQGTTLFASSTFKAELMRSVTSSAEQGDTRTLSLLLGGKVDDFWVAAIQAASSKKKTTVVNQLLETKPYLKDYACTAYIPKTIEFSVLTPSQIHLTLVSEVHHNGHQYF